MKNNYQEIIDKFGEGRIGIGKVIISIIENNNPNFSEEGSNVIRMWKQCGINKSLSEILSDETIKFCIGCAKQVEGEFCQCGDSGTPEHSPKATKLFQLLKTL